MKDNFNDIWEAMLKAAVLENSYNLVKDYSSVEEINKMKLPRQYEMKMHKVIRHYQKKNKSNKIHKICRQSCLLVTCCCRYYVHYFAAV